MKEVSPELIHTLSLLMILTSFAAVEARNLRHASVAYLGQALLICSLLFAYSTLNRALLYWAATALITKAVLIPWFLWRFTAKSEQETKPIIGFGISAILLVILLAAMFKLTHTYAHMFVNTTRELTIIAELNLAVAFTVFVLGLYGILTRRDAVKSVIGLCLLENGVHLSLVSLAPTIKETALAGIATEVVITVYLLLYIVDGIREKFDSTDTFKLSELRW
jgi:hydrogenase-4 component E